MNSLDRYLSVSVLNGLKYLATTNLPALLSSGADAYIFHQLEKLKTKTISFISDSFNIIHPFNVGIVSFVGRYTFHEIGEKTNKREKGEEKSFRETHFNPVGSPYGFTNDDWRFISLRRKDKSILYVIFGLQYRSDYYCTDQLTKNIRKHFKKAVMIYNKKHPKSKIVMHFEVLTAGYGEHLFNTIARSIIGADISVFEASDHNSNVMIELGVALTWGIFIIPLREKNGPELPSDISGYTYVVYEKSGEKILDKEFHTKLVKMIERAISKKRRLSEG